MLFETLSEHGITNAWLKRPPWVDNSLDGCRSIQLEPSNQYPDRAAAMIAPTLKRPYIPTRSLESTIPPPLTDRITTVLIPAFIGSALILVVVKTKCPFIQRRPSELSA